MQGALALTTVWLLMRAEVGIGPKNIGGKYQEGKRREKRERRGGREEVDEG